jgi:hypothetical protein
MYTNKNTVGQSGFYFFFGKVEDRQDPMKIGRVRVRCFGIHDESPETVKNSHLPWASVIVSSGSNEREMPDLKVGCVVFGFFADGEEMQVPMILGVLPGIIGEKIASESGAPTYPEYAPESTQRTLNQSSLSSYATQGSRLSNVAKSQFGFGTEPADPYAGVYPYVHARESESGHVIELDDTPGAERVHIFHRAGSYVEFHPDGTTVMKSVNNGFDIVMNDKNVSVGGNVNITINGNANITCPNVNIDGNVNVTGDVVASGISLVSHIHSGVKSGAGLSGPPV